MERTLQEILDHHNEAVFSGDVEAMKFDYTDDAVLIGLGGVFKGHAEHAPLRQSEGRDDRRGGYDAPSLGA